MKQFEIKNTDNSVLDVDDKSRRVKVVISKMGNLDLDGDVIDPKAFNRTIKDRGPKGANLIWHLTDHYPSLKSAVGKFSELKATEDELVGVTDIPKTNWGNDVLEFYKAGHINQHSIGFRTITAEPVNAGKNNEHRLIKEIFLYEGSAVLWGANPETPTLSVGKSMTKEEVQNSIIDALKEITNLAKLFKSGHFTDDTFELLELQLAQKAEQLLQLHETSIQPAQKAFVPESESLLDGLKSFNNLLILTNETRGIAGTA